MLIGEYTHSQDDKKRISLPAKFKKEIGKKVVITHGLDNCLFMFGIKEWVKISEKLGSLSMGQASSRGFNRMFLGGAVEVDVDSVGRILIPDFAGVGMAEASTAPRHPEGSLAFAIAALTISSFPVLVRRA